MNDIVSMLMCDAMLWVFVKCVYLYDYYINKTISIAHKMSSVSLSWLEEACEEKQQELCATRRDL